MIHNSHIVNVVENQRVYFNSNITRSYDFRVMQLKKLRDGLSHFEDEFIKALKLDLGKCEFEAYATEVGFVSKEVTDTIKHLKRWMKKKKVPTPILCQPGSSQILYTPRGVNLIITPYNYPVGLTLSSLIAAIAAGNTAVIKTSEHTPHCSTVIRKCIEYVFAPEYIAYIEGAVPETTELLAQQFDHIFFTGSIQIGKVVLTAAAKNLTPVTLELGGKSPCIVHADADIDIAVNRIVYGKFLNAGQTCIAPDYVMVHSSVKLEFLNKIKTRIITLYGDDASLSPHYGRIVNPAHHKRLTELIDKDKVIVGAVCAAVGQVVASAAFAVVFRAHGQ